MVELGLRGGKLPGQGGGFESERCGRDDEGDDEGDEDLECADQRVDLPNGQWERRVCFS